jgi:hypothetical protein
VSSEVLEVLLLLLRESLLREPYLMVLPVLRRIHWGMGRFCFCAFASFCLVRKDFWDCAVVRRVRWGELPGQQGGSVPASWLIVECEFRCVVVGAAEGVGEYSQALCSASG